MSQTTIHYTIETVFEGCRYDGYVRSDALSALVGLGETEGYAVVEVEGVYSFALSNRLENDAMSLALR